ncbi:MAG: hypothetical protein GY705_20165 [Bacteroidetes bacterium]|nr:hypothetical protein [Bacteroidota bacterium]
MPNTNASLKEIIEDARLICKNKLLLIQTKFGGDHPEVSATQEEQTAVFSHFDNPEFWTVSIEMDEAILKEHIEKVDAISPDGLEDYLNCIENLLDLLEEGIVEVVEEQLNAGIISDFNLKVLNALRKTRQIIGGRKRYFKNQGIDLGDDPDFQEMVSQQDKAIREYRKLLRSNAIVSKETDVNIVNRFGSEIRKATVLRLFFALYKALTRIIKRKLRTSPPPVA